MMKMLQQCLVISCQSNDPTAAAGDTKVVGNPDNYAWLEAINTPVYIYMRTGMYTGPTVQVLYASFYTATAKEGNEQNS